MSINFVDLLSDSEIQKYNGKSVKVVSLSNIIFDPHNVMVVFKTPAIRASDEVKLRAFLKKYGIVVKRFKRKNFAIMFKILKNSEYFHGDIFHNFLQFMEGSGVVLVFEDLTHFFFFEKFILLKLLKLRFLLFSIKFNNQYFLTSSNVFSDTILNLKKYNYDLCYINSLFFFQNSVVRNFIYIFIYFKFQDHLYSFL